MVMSLKVNPENNQRSALVYKLCFIILIAVWGYSASLAAQVSIKEVSGKCIAETETEKRIKGLNHTLLLKKTDGDFQVQISDGKDKLFYQDCPAQITVRSNDTLSAGNYAEESFSQAYHSVTREKYGFRAVARVKSGNGSVFTVEDKYTLLTDDVFVIYRDVTVNRAGTGDAGFASTVSFLPKQSSASQEDYEYFIPSILYRNTSEVRETSIGADLNVDRMYVKETRSGLPLAMLREKASGNTLTLMHYKPLIDVKNNPGGGVPGEVNDELQYGSIGYSIQPILSVDFCYPCAEGPRTYDVARRKGSPPSVWSKRYHQVREGNQHNYAIALLPDKNNTYQEAMITSFRTAFSVENPEIVLMDMSAIYDQNMDLFKAEYREYGTGAVQSAGLPWSLDLPGGANREGVSFQMGFVGQQMAVGYHMYRYGLDNKDAETRRKGKAMVDFWVSDAIMNTYFPTVWWDPANNETAGQRRDYPSFLRCFVDGMEGLLDACRISAAYGESQKKWDEALRRVASHLVEKQNEDGSFYRAYKTNGEVETGGDRNTRGTSKLNTPLTVRFLVKMHEHTGEEKYKEAAIRAADFSYNELYLKLGKYVGGTPDNPNTVDKEAAIYALYCFNAAHTLTGDAKYLKAAEHAACSAMSWTYCYDFAIPNRNEEDARKNPFTKGGIVGFSIIATGHSGADNFISYMFYEMYTLYVKTGNAHYLHMARLLQNNTKSNTDFDGRMGYKYRAFMPEATNVADLAFRSVSVWLPWASIANIEPIIHLEEAFGQKDISRINESLPQLRARLEQYGAGGNPLKRSVQEIRKVPLGDPFILLHENVYYAYGTHSENGIAVYTSTDLKSWKAAPDLALDKKDVWGGRWFWAPEVYAVNKKFYMYYSGNEHICVATSDSPLGPFVQVEKKPMIADEKCIDNSLFIDKGKAYLYFDRFNDGLNIWVAQLEDNLTDIKPGSMKPCIHVSQQWETVWPRVNEGPFVIKHKGTYYMTYSGNSYESPFYGIGFAIAPSPSGPWTKYENNPILQKPGDLAGVGHSALFTDKKGELRIVFHAHHSQTSIHPRAMYISTVRFQKEGNKTVMVIDPAYETPVLID